MELNINEILKIRTDIPLSSVTRFHMQWCINDHAHLKLYGDISYEAAVRYQNKNCSGNCIIVTYFEEQKEQVLFNGLVRNSVISFEGRCAQIEIEGISATWKLDIVKQFRSFQDTDMTYAALARKVADYTGASVISLIGKNTKLQKPLIQYRETDWEFLRRISSHLNKYILCDVITGKPAFWFGMRNGKRVVLPAEHSYDLNFDPILKRQVYIVNSRNAYKIGDKVMYRGEELIILRRECVFHDELIFTYTLGSESVLDQTIQYNCAISGCGFWGKVIAISGEMLKIALEMDRDEECGEYWFPWRPETGNIMYAMPEIGSTVLLTIPGNDERCAIANSCLHKEEAIINRGWPFEKRQLETMEGSVIKLYQEKLEFSRKEGDHLLHLSDGNILCKTNKRIKIEAGKKVYLKSVTACIKASERIDGIVG